LAQRVHAFTAASLLSVACGNRKCENTRWLEKIWLSVQLQDTKDWDNTNVINRNERVVPVCRHLKISRIIMERMSVSWTVHRTAGSDTSRQHEDRRGTFRHHSTKIGVEHSDITARRSAWIIPTSLHFYAEVGTQTNNFSER